MRRFPLLIALAISCALALAGPAAADQPSLLFSTTSKDVRIGGSGKAMRVSLPARAPLAWFSDRPDRRTGSSTAAFLVSSWQANGFASVPPNAALVTTARGTTMQTIVTLRDPRLANGRVSFRYTVLDKGEMLGMRTNGHPRTGRYSGELFVDDATLPPCTPGTNYVHASYSQCVTSGVNDYRFLNDVEDGWQTTYACGAGLRVRHYAPGDVTYALNPCPQSIAVGSSERITFDFGTTSSVSYSQNSFTGVPAGVTFTVSFDPLCGPSANPTSGLYACVLPAGSSVSITRATDGNTRINACGLNGASSLTYDSTAAGVIGYRAPFAACDTTTVIADVPTTIATVIVHATTDTRLLLNAG